MFLFWLIFLFLIGFILILDLGVLNKKDHVMGIKEALRWTLVWIFVSFAFNVAIYFLYGHGLIGFPRVQKEPL